MRDPAFWWRSPGLASALLAPFGHLYGTVTAGRLRRPGRGTGVPVVCIGNPTVGGAGKTPTALAVARWLQAAGERPAFLTRGYGGRLAGPVRVDPAVHAAAEVGDEALLLARVAPTMVSRDRVAGAAAAREQGASVVVMDDGFQNPSLVKDVSLLVVDAQRGIGNGRVFPAGPLRAPLAAQLERADALLLIGAGTAADLVGAAAEQRGLPVFRGRLQPDGAAVAALRGRKALAFAGIGDPEKFFATLRAAGIETPACRAFPDHHRYVRSEADALVRQAERDGLILLTTEKDLVRLAKDPDGAALSRTAQALPVALVVGEPGLREFLLGRLQAE
jgi:tetraacyldisaccharide 4'-kinase